jgi:hypothetical protein
VGFGAGVDGNIGMSLKEKRRNYDRVAYSARCEPGWGADVFCFHASGVAMVAEANRRLRHKWLTAPAMINGKCSILNAQ